MRLNKCAGQVVGVVTLIFMGPGVAGADPVPVPDVDRSVGTAQGYQLGSTLTNTTINSVPNMAATAFTREGFITATATETIDGTGTPRDLSVTGGKLDLAVQLGCQIDLSQGGQIAFNSNPSLNFDTVFEPQNVSPSIANLAPTIQVTLKPGTIKYERLGRLEIDDKNVDEVNDELNTSGKATLETTVHDAHVRVDSCGGPVNVRVLAVAQIRTATAFDEVNLYGDILPI